MRESERVSGRSTGETAKCPFVHRVSDLGHTANTGAHDKHFLFSILNQSMEKKYGKTPLCRVPRVWHTSKKFFAVCHTPGTRQTFFLFIQIWKHVSLSLTKCMLQRIIKLTKHITRSPYFKILYFCMHVYLNLNIPTLILRVLKNSKNGKQIQKFIMIEHELLLCGVLPI